METQQLSGSCDLTTSGLKLQYAGCSDAGCRRQNNQDAMGIFCGESQESSLLLLVADGVGGNATGEVASQTAVETVGARYFSHGEPEDPSSVLKEAISGANQAILNQAAADPRSAGMATTCTAAVIRDQAVWIGHLGDSRAYMIGPDGLTQLTKDHSVAEEYARQGQLIPPEKKAYANVLTRWLGSNENYSCDIIEALPLKPGYSLVLCSDGLTKVLDSDDILHFVSQHPPQAACHLMVNLARERGGPDNITVVIARLEAACL